MVECMVKRFTMLPPQELIVKLMPRYVNFASAEIVLFFAEVKTQIYFKVDCLIKVSSPSSHLQGSKGFPIGRDGYAVLPIFWLNSLAQNTPNRYCSNCSNGK